MDKETREAFEILTVRLLAVRDVVARLLAYEAMRHHDPRGLLQHFSDATDHRIDRSGDGLKIGPETMKVQEAARKELDWMVAAARAMIEAAEEC